MSKFHKVRFLIMGLSFLLLLPILNLILSLWVFDNAFQAGAELLSRMHTAREAMETKSVTCNPSIPENAKLEVAEVKSLFLGLGRDAKEMLRAGFSHRFDMGLVSAFHLLRMNTEYTAAVRRLGGIGDEALELSTDFNKVVYQLCAEEDEIGHITTEQSLNSHIHGVLTRIRTHEKDLGLLLSDYNHRRPFALTLLWALIIFESTGYGIALQEIYRWRKRRRDREDPKVQDPNGDFKKVLGMKPGRDKEK